MMMMMMLMIMLKMMMMNDDHEEATPVGALPSVESLGKTTRDSNWL